ncbi:MAG: 4Fe-4S dicluster domain-containing protein [Pseudomonadota bacterium]
MEWTEEAEEAIKKVPFFVRKKVRARVEDDVGKAGKGRVSLSDVRLSQKKYLARMSDEVKGYQLEACFGAGGCPNRAVVGGKLMERLEKALREAEIRKFLEKNVTGGLKHHHEFRVAVADCPNACSQPQIRDLGIIGALEPDVGSNPCTLCGACAEACREEAATLGEAGDVPVIELNRCVKCGRCIDVCPTGTLAAKRSGYRVQVGGKLGRHPRLAMEFPGIYTEDEVIEILHRCLRFYKEKSTQGKRFAELFHHVKDLGL